MNIGTFKSRLVNSNLNQSKTSDVNFTGNASGNHSQNISFKRVVHVDQASSIVQSVGSLRDIPFPSKTLYDSAKRFQKEGKLPQWMTMVLKPPHSEPMSEPHRLNVLIGVENLAEREGNKPLAKQILTFLVNLGKQGN